MSIGKTVQIERAIMAALRPLTGDRATGTATVSATGSDILLPKNCALVPVAASVTGAKQVAPDRLVRVKEATTVSSGGTSVPITSLLGGARQNFTNGTKLRFEPALLGVEPEAELDGDMTGGADPSGEGSVFELIPYEAIGTVQAHTALFAAKLRKVPAIVLGWADSVYTRRNRTMVHVGDRWDLFVVVSRSDGHLARAHEGKYILDAAQDLLIEKRAIDGAIFSDPPTSLVSRRRFATTPTSYVYVLSFETFNTADRTDLRPGAAEQGSWADWLRTRYDLDTATTPPFPVVDGAVYDMPTP